MKQIAINLPGIEYYIYFCSRWSVIIIINSIAVLSKNVFDLRKLFNKKARWSESAYGGRDKVHQICKNRDYHLPRWI